MFPRIGETIWGLKMRCFLFFLLVRVLLVVLYIFRCVCVSVYVCVFVIACWPNIVSLFCLFAIAAISHLDARLMSF